MRERTLFERRFSCRRFSDRAIGRDLIERLLEAAVLAPSGGNLQPWRFVIVLDPGRRHDLAAAAHGQSFVAAAPVVIAACAVPGESARTYGDRGRQLYCLQDTAAAVENLMLAATGEGLGACWVGAFDEAAATRALGLPAGWRPVALVPVGYPAEAAPARSRRPLDEVCVWLD